MHPYLHLTWFTNQSITISSYRLFFILAGVAVLVIGMIGIRRKDLPRCKAWMILLAMAVSVPIGARGLHILTNPVIYQQTPAKMWSLQLTGFSLMGGLVLATLTGICISWWLCFDPWPLADCVAPGLGVGIVLMRIGCYLNGCCFGKVADLPWAVHFPMGSIPYKYYLPGLLDKQAGFPLTLFRSPGVHPTQLYELLAALAITALVIYLDRKKLPSGIPFLVFALLFSAFRWINSMFRVPAHTLNVPDIFYPLLYAGIILLASILLVFRLTKRRGCRHSLK